ncbi:hypothetical protein BJ546DRAFT_134452 [Cryomyces antarcticus]
MLHVSLLLHIQTLVYTLPVSPNSTQGRQTFTHPENPTCEYRISPSTTDLYYVFTRWMRFVLAFGFGFVSTGGVLIGLLLTRPRRNGLSFSQTSAFGVTACIQELLGHVRLDWAGLGWAGLKSSYASETIKALLHMCGPACLC